MKLVILGSGIAAWRAAREAVKTFDTVIMIGPDAGLLSSFFGYEQGGHVYGPSSQEALAGHGIVLDGPSIERKCFYYQGEALADYREFPYPVQASWPSAVQNPFPAYAGQSLEEFAIAAFGESFYREWYGPFNKRVWGIDPHRMDSNWVIGRVSTASAGTKNWGPNSSFRWASGDTLLRQMMFQSPKLIGVSGVLKAIRSDSGGHTVYASSTPPGIAQAAFKCDAILSTIPLNILLDTVPTDVAGWRFPYNYVTTYGVTTNVAHSGRDFTWVYSDLRSAVHRVTNFSRYTGEEAMVGKYLFEMPHAASTYHSGIDTRAQEMDPLSLPYPITQAMRALGIDPGAVVHAARKTHMGYPVPTIDIQAEVAICKHELAKQNIFLAGRWGSHGYFNVDHTCNDALAASEAMVSWFDKRSLPSTYTLTSHYYERTQS